MPRAAALFSEQHGLATTAQLLDAGVPEGVIRARVAGGEWGRPRRGLIALPGAWSWDRSAHAALLLGGDHCALSHAAAARLHRFDGYDRDERLALTGIGRAYVRQVAGVEVHRSRVLQRRHCVRLRSGLHVVTIPVALIQIAASDGADAAARALDGLLRDGVRPMWIQQVTDEWRTSGVSGPDLVVELLRERVDRRLPRSWFQRLTKRLLSRHLLDLVEEFPVRDGTGKLAELDLAIPSLKIGIECQSWTWHATPSAKDHDNRRKRRLRAIGWEILEVWWTDLDRIEEVAHDVGIEIARRQPTLPGMS